MNQKQIGVLLLIIGIFAALLTLDAKLRDDRNIDLLITAQNGSCYLADGTCLHDDRSYMPYIIGGTISFSLLILGLYLIFFDRTQYLLIKQQQDLKKELDATKRIKEFDAFLSGFDEQEKKVLKAIKEQDGIKQSTLRYRTGMSKTALSLILKNLESRKLISKKLSGKTNQIYLQKKF